MKKIVSILAIILVCALAVAAFTVVFRIKKDNREDKTSESDSCTISGAWLFDFDEIYPDTERVTYDNISFISNGDTYSSMSFGFYEDIEIGSNYYGYPLYYDNSYVLKSDAVWVDENYKIVDFGEKQTVSVEFLEFMKRNAIKLEISGVYLDKDEMYCTKYEPIDEESGYDFDLKFSYDGVNYIGIYLYELSVYFRHIDSSKDLCVGNTGDFNIHNIEIDFGETPQEVSFETWDFIHRSLIKKAA